jgi:hypothetical protein
MSGRKHRRKSIREAKRRKKLKGRKSVQRGRGAKDKVASALEKGFDAASTAVMTAGGPIGVMGAAALELLKRVSTKAIKANWKQTKRAEFNKAYEPVYSKRNPGQIVGYNRRKNAGTNRYHEDYGFGKW